MWEIIVLENFFPDEVAVKALHDLKPGLWRMENNFFFFGQIYVETVGVKIYIF